MELQFEAVRRVMLAETVLRPPQIEGDVGFSVERYKHWTVWLRQMRFLHC